MARLSCEAVDYHVGLFEIALVLLREDDGAFILIWSKFSGD